MNNWYTADSHFGNDSLSILMRDNRLFKDNAEYTAEQVRIWNEQAAPDDTIYAIGDFCNYNDREKDYVSGLAVSKQINAHISRLTTIKSIRLYSVTRTDTADFGSHSDLMSVLT